MIELEKSGLNRFSKITTISNLHPISCAVSETIDSAVAKIIDSAHRSLPVVDKNSKIVGIVTSADILDSFLIGQDFSHPVSEVMHRDVLTCNADDTIGFVLQKFKMSRKGRFPVKKEGKLVGIVSERSFVQYFANINFENKLESIMTKKPLFVSSNISIIDAMKTIVNTHYRRLPVVSDNKLVGFVMSGDLLKILRIRNYKFSLLQNPISSVMIKNLITVKKDADISAAIKAMLVHEIDGVLVSDDDRLEGIVTERNILEQIN